MQRDKISFETNVPKIIRLDFPPDGAPLKPGRYGDQYMFVVNEDAGVMFVDPPVRDLIVSTGAQAGDEVAITRREVRENGRKAVRWEVERVEEEPEPPPPPPPPPDRPANGAPKPAQPQPAPQLAEQLCEAHREAHCALCRQSQANPLTPALTAAIDAAAAAEQHARTRGLAIRFSSEDVRAMALSLYIDSRRSK
jgi:hypothetical protein